jgi:hypothetical protein
MAEASAQTGAGRQACDIDRPGAGGPRMIKRDSAGYGITGTELDTNDDVSGHKM